MGYRYYETVNKAVRYPFGYGLSYTTFAYSDLKVNAEKVTFTLTNTGSCDGAEVAQLYVAKPDAKVFRPARELKGFRKLHLRPGETGAVEFTLTSDELALLDRNLRPVVEPGTFNILVGASGDDIRLKGSFEIRP